MNSSHIVLNNVARQYNEKWRFPDYDCAIKRLQCHHVHSFLSCNPQHFEGIIHDYDVPVYVCKFCPNKMDSHMLAVANENGTVCIENTAKDNVKTYVQTHNNTVFDLAWMPGEKQFVTVSGDHSAKLWDCGESDIKVVSEFLGHTRSVKCVYFKPENTSVFATGSRDGSLIIWDARCSRKCSKVPASHIPDQVIPSAAGTSPFVPKRKYYPIEASQSNSVTGLLFQNDNTLVSSGSSDQCVRVWDMRKTYSRTATIPLPRYQLLAPSPGFSNICIDPAGTRIYANSMDSYIYCFNANSYHPDPISAFYGHQNGSFYVKSGLSHDGWYLLSGSTDKYAFIWNTRKAELSSVALKPIAALPGHTAEVACIAMSSDGDMKVATCSDDGTYRVWYNYNLDRFRDLDESIDTADIFDWDITSTVRTQWKNKRKRGYIEDDDDDSSTTTEEMPCTFHTKICRYYSNSLSSIFCKCQRHLYQDILLKRPSEDETDDASAAKRPALVETQESTSLKSDEVETAINRVSNHDVNIPKTSNSPKKITLKRKLSELPNVDECESKRMASESIEPPADAVETTKSKDEAEGDVAVSDSGGGVRRNANNIEHGESEKANDQRDYEEHCRIPEFSSPTTNLPNYVKDGTSPYLHRCPRTQRRKRSTVDWLTKLRNNCAKRMEIEKQAEEQESSSKVSKNEGKVQIVGMKRKLVRSHSTEGKNTTLHKYFKISNRPGEMGYIPQDIQKKTC